MAQEVAIPLLTFLLLTSCASSPEARLRRTLSTQTTGVIRLPSGIVEVSSELTLAPGAHDLELIGSGTVLKARDDFHGRAILVADGAKNIRIRDVSIEGSLAALARPREIIPPENAFRVYYPDNGLLFDRVEGVAISGVHAGHIAGFPILLSRSSAIRVSNVVVEDSGARNARGRNNLSGGILIEEGCTDFEVRDSTFRRIPGNGLWTHSMFIAPRQSGGVFANNRFETIGRDAIQVGHASRVRVENNTGSSIGWPIGAVDIENGGTPVAIDTAGNVDHSVYSGNRFEEIDGKCIDLDGFHDGSVLNNACVNRKLPGEYPFGHFGIVMNNTNPDMRAENIELRGNLIDGARFGGLFLIGRGHVVANNRFLNLDTSGCNESAATFACIYKADEPEMLESGIYLGRGVARMEETRDNVVEDNVITGHRMDARCIAAAPGVKLAANTIRRNRCALAYP